MNPSPSSPAEPSSEPTLVEKREQAVFDSALTRPSDEREAYLAIACAGNEGLLNAVRARLEAHEKAGPLLKTDPGGLAGEAEETTEHGGRFGSGRSVCHGESAGDTIGRYKLLQQIGEGGFGVVWMAEQTAPVRRRVALKIIKPGMDSKAIIGRFEQERQALAMMDHPNIAKVLDAGATDTGRPYFVMELVRGIRITDYCDQAKLHTAERLRLFIAVCHAVQHAHQKGIIHRDLKPSNILVTLHDGVPVPKVIDFGVAKATQQQLTDLTVFTQFEEMIGTPLYMSPEQAEMSGLDIDTRSDIYSLGVLLYELLTGRTPFNPQELFKHGLVELRRVIREQEPPRPSTALRTMEAGTASTVAVNRQSEAPKLIVTLRGDLDWIVMKALEKDRNRRYDTANGFAQDIERYLHNEAIVARPPSTAYLLQKLVRRHRHAVSAIAAVVLALIAGIAVSTWQAVRAKRAERIATQAQSVAETERDHAVKSEREAKDQQKRAEAARRETQQNLYAADMNLAGAAWDEANGGRLRGLLEEARTYPDRGFEWYYWQRQMHLELRSLRGHRDAVTSVAYSSDGRRIVTGSADETAKVWDAGTGGELLTLKGHLGAVFAVAISSNGRRIATASGDRTAKVWDADSGRELLALKGHKSDVVTVAFSPDGSRIATGSGDQTVKVWDAADGHELLTLKGHQGAVTSVAFSADGRRIATGSIDKTAKLWEAESGRELMGFQGHGWNVYAVALSPDGRRLATGSGDRTAKVWDTETGQELRTVGGLVQIIRSVAFSHDGHRLLTAGTDFSSVWDAEDGRELLSFKGHTDHLNAAIFSPDDRQVVTGSDDLTARVWKAAGDNPVLTFTGHEGFIKTAAVAANGRRIVTGAVDKTAKVWDVETRGEISLLKGHAAEIWTVALSPDGRRVATGSRDKTARIWDADTGREMLVLRGHDEEINEVAYSSDGRKIVTASSDHTAKVWDAATGRELLTLKHSEDVYAVAFSSDNRKIATGTAGALGKVWDAESGRELLTFKGHVSIISVIAFSPDGSRIVTSGGDRTPEVWDVKSGRKLMTLQTGSVYTVAFSPDGRRVITGGNDRLAKLWDVETGQELLTLKGHNSAMRAVGFTSDGRRVLTASGGPDPTARIWDAASPAEVEVWDKQDAETRKLVQAREQQQQELQNALTELESAINEKNWAKADTVLATVETLGPADDRAFREDELARKLADLANDGKLDPPGLELAKKLATAALQIANGTNPYYLDTLAWVLSLQGDRVGAVRVQSDAVENATDDEKSGFQETLDRFKLRVAFAGVESAIAEKKWEEASTKFAGVEKLGPKETLAEVANEFAWELATKADMEPQALAMAETISTRANEAVQNKKSRHLATLARILFREGKKEVAIQTQEQAVTLAEEKDKPDLQKILDSYRRGELPKP